MTFRIVVIFGRQKLYFMTSQIFALGELNICPKLWCNYWLSCENGRQNCYVLTRFRVDNCINACLLCLWRNLDAHWHLIPRLKMGDGQCRRPIQWHASVVGSSSTRLLQTMPAIRCQSYYTYSQVRSSSGNSYITGQPIAYEMGKNLVRN